MNHQNQRQAQIKISVNALKQCKSFIGDFLDMYYNRELGKRKDDAITTASCINDCCKAFVKNFNQYIKTTNDK